MRMLLENVSDNRDKWLELRQETIGSSEIATVVGMNPYDTEFDLWALKTGKIPPKETTDAMMMGTELEPVVGKLFSRRTRLEVERANCLVAHDDHAWATASPDFWVQLNGARKILEAKFTTARNRHIWDDGVPKVYMLQLNWQLGVCEIDHGYVAGLIGGDAEDFPWENLVFAPELFAYCVERGERFMELVRSDIPPLAGPGDSKLIAQLQGDRAADLEVMTEDALPLAAEFTAAKEQRAQVKKELEAADAEYDRAKGRLLQVLGSKQIGALPDGRIVSAKTVKNPGYTVSPFEYVSVDVKIPKEKSYGRRR